jgi:hypothetical protein
MNSINVCVCCGAKGTLYELDDMRLKCEACGVLYRPAGALPDHCSKTCPRWDRCLVNKRGKPCPYKED